ncbi:hypothetical protein QQF64_021137 [Cirrhinus molitorella]|uniref:Uncharacterized protein n=1 Tax=Cirrhinus molitorella TaxID=172907 RepID=A0ABR3LB89_9TELE
MGNGCHGGTWQESEKDAARASRRTQMSGEIWGPRSASLSRSPAVQGVVTTARGCVCQELKNVSPAAL